MSEELELLKSLATGLNKAGINYMMTGSMAMAFYSMPRMTRDIDIIIHVSAGDCGRIITLLQVDYYVDEECVREAIRTRGMFNAIHNESIIKIDFIIRKDEEYRIEEFGRRKLIEIEGVKVSVVAPEDLILSKLVWAKNADSDLQFRDAAGMLGGLEGLDKAYLIKWATVLGINDVLKKAGKHG